MKGAGDAQGARGAASTGYFPDYESNGQLVGMLDGSTRRRPGDRGSSAIGRCAPGATPRRTASFLAHDWSGPMGFALRGSYDHLSGGDLGERWLAASLSAYVANGRRATCADRRRTRCGRKHWKGDRKVEWPPATCPVSPTRSGPVRDPRPRGWPRPRACTTASPIHFPSDPGRPSPATCQLDNGARAITFDVPWVGSCERRTQTGPPSTRPARPGRRHLAHRTSPAQTVTTLWGNITAILARAPGLSTPGLGQPGATSSVYGAEHPSGPKSLYELPSVKRARRNQLGVANGSRLGATRR